MLALPQRALVDISGGGLVVGHVLLGNFGQFGEEEQNHHGGSEAGNTEVHKLHAVERALSDVVVAEEGLTGDQRADEGSETVESLGEVEAESGLFRRPEDGHVTVGAHFQRGQTAGDDESRDDESWEALEFGRRPEAQSADAVESESHVDTVAVAEARDELTSNGGVDDVCALNASNVNLRVLAFS